MPLGLLRSIASRPVVSPIGLDVGPRRLRAAQLSGTGGRWRILHVAQWDRREAEAGGGISEGFARRIQQTLSKDGFRGRRLVAGLSMPDVELHNLEIPNKGEMSDKRRFADAAHWELQRVAGIAPDQAASGYWPVPSGDGNRTTAIGAIARRDDIQNLNDLAKAIKLDCERVDSTSCALSRLGSLLRRRNGSDPKEVWSVLDVGGRMLRLLVAVDESPVLVRNLGTGGDDWTSSVAESLQLSTEAAEIHKCDHGITPRTDSDAGDGLSEIAGLIYNVLRGDLNLVAAEIERSYDYTMRCYPNRPAGGVLLVGAGADLKGLDAFLYKKLGVNVTTLNQAVEQSDGSLVIDRKYQKSLNAFGGAIGLAINPESDN